MQIQVGDAKFALVWQKPGSWRIFRWSNFFTAKDKPVDYFIFARLHGLHGGTLWFKVLLKGTLQAMPSQPEAGCQ